MEIIQRVAPEAGLVAQANCSAFLSKTEEYDVDVGLVRDVQTQAEAILFPAVEMNSTLLKLLSKLLNAEELAILADNETPTALSATQFDLNSTMGQNRMLRDQGVDDEELEDHHDISSEHPPEIFLASNFNPQI